jgi:hypothetical protein
METFRELLIRQQQERMQFIRKAGARQASQTRNATLLILEAVRTSKVSSPWAVSDLAKELEMEQVILQQCGGISGAGMGTGCPPTSGE